MRRKLYLAMSFVGLASAFVASPVGAAEPFEDVFARTSAVVQATATNCGFAYSATIGPRSQIALTVNAVILGTYASPTLVLRFAGGPIPGTTKMVRVSQVDRFVCGKTYVLFLTNSPWFDSPLAMPAARIESAFGKSIVVLDHGYGIQGIGPKGYYVSNDPVFSGGVEWSTPFNPRPLAPTATTATVAPLYTPAQFISAIQAYATSKGISLGGTFPSNPRSDIAWPNSPPAKFDPSGTYDPCTNSDPCADL